MGAHRALIGITVTNVSLAITWQLIYSAKSVPFLATPAWGPIHYRTAGRVKIIINFTSGMGPVPTTASVTTLAKPVWGVPQSAASVKTGTIRATGPPVWSASMDVCHAKATPITAPSAKTASSFLSSLGSVKSVMLTARAATSTRGGARAATGIRCLMWGIGNA
jgi:hypothetical protein